MNTYHELAAAMRKGAALRPQATNGEYFQEPALSDTEPFASCSLGAAYEGIHGPFATWSESPVYLNTEPDWEAFPVLWEAAPVCPDPDCPNDPHYSVYLSFDSRDELFDLINHLNDEHKWTREQVADWLDSL